jgi:septum formation protein
MGATIERRAFPSPSLPYSRSAERKKPLTSHASDLPQKNSAPPRLALASASPRRQELIALLGVPFTVCPSRYEEPPPPTTPVDLAAFVTTLATHKAQEVAARMEGGSLVLGADTLVTLAEEGPGVPLGKPVDREDARRMLRLLSDRDHCVYTGLALIAALGEGRSAEPLCTSVRTRVRFCALNDAMIEGYLATGEPFDKAGAYGAQGYAAPFIARLEGDYFNVVGLPLCAVGTLLEQAGFDWWRYRTQTPPLIG